MYSCLNEAYFYSPFFLDLLPISLLSHCVCVLLEEVFFLLLAISFSFHVDWTVYGLMEHLSGNCLVAGSGAIHSALSSKFFGKYVSALWGIGRKWTIPCQWFLLYYIHIDYFFWALEHFWRNNLVNKENRPYLLSWLLWKEHNITFLELIGKLLLFYDSFPVGLFTNIVVSISDEYFIVFYSKFLCRVTTHSV